MVCQIIKQLKIWKAWLISRYVDYAMDPFTRDPHHPIHSQLLTCHSLSARQKRIDVYRASYESLTPESYKGVAFVKIIELGKSFIVNGIGSPLEFRVTEYESAVQ